MSGNTDNRGNSMKTILHFKTLAAMAGVAAIAAPMQGVYADQVINNDLIVTGSQCIGFDCVNGETFGFDTLRLKENNLRLHFDDTSNTGSFPNQDWRIKINDTTNGGGEYFAIEDATVARTPFRIDAGAPTDSLRVDSGGDVGLGVASPVVELHIADGDTPTVRLEQNGTSGWSPQTWDLAGNETNFFVRDVSNGSKLPFRIRPDAPTNSLNIASDGNIGLGTASPSADLHVFASTGGAIDETHLLIKRPDAGFVTAKLSSASGTEDWAIVNFDSASFGLAIGETTNNNGGANIFGNGRFRLLNGDLGPGVVIFEVASNGDVTADGIVTATSFAYTSGGGGTVPDYVFQEDYRLMPIDELAAFIKKKKHLPNVPSAAEVEAKGSVNMAELQMTLLEKIEELTLYTVQQEEKIDRLQARLSEMEGAK
jgi:hypothetical protein